MNRATLKNELDKLVNELGSVRQMPEFEKIFDKAKSPKYWDSGMDELLDNLRVGIKYLLFDNEASEREIAVLHRLLKKNE